MQMESQADAPIVTRSARRRHRTDQLSSSTGEQPLPTTLPATACRTIVAIEQNPKHAKFNDALTNYKKADGNEFYSDSNAERIGTGEVDLVNHLIEGLAKIVSWEHRYADETEATRSA